MKSKGFDRRRAAAKDGEHLEAWGPAGRCHGRARLVMSSHCETGQRYAFRPSPRLFAAAGASDVQKESRAKGGGAADSSHVFLPAAFAALRPPLPRAGQRRGRLRFRPPSGSFSRARDGRRRAAGRVRRPEGQKRGPAPAAVRKPAACRPSPPPRSRRYKARKEWEHSAIVAASTRRAAMKNLRLMIVGFAVFKRGTQLRGRGGGEGRN